MYFSLALKTMLSTRWAACYGREAWDHLMGCLNAHETADCEVRDWGEFPLTPYSLEQARRLAEVGRNTDRRCHE
jgi:hypothetical protein